MAFMALFGWIFLPIILLALCMRTLAELLYWAARHAALLNVAVGVLLAGNLLVFTLLLRARSKWKKQSRPAGWRLFRSIVPFILILGLVWEALMVLLCILYLIVQPLRYLPMPL